MRNESLYYGNTQQVRGIEEYKLVEGRGANMRMMHVRNGLGLEVTIAIDRCADISRVTFKGDNLGYFSPAGHVAPQFYDARRDEMTRSFTGGFLMTCGLTNVGEVCIENGDELPLHGRISNQPAEHAYWIEEDEEFVVKAVMREASLFLEKLELKREIHISKIENKICIKDTITNRGAKESPCMILYHMNMGYPLLCEDSILEINSHLVRGRNKLATEKLENWNVIEKPEEKQDGVCYYHEFKEEGFARIYNPKINKGVEISYDARELPCFTQWKQLGKYDYVLGLEPGNCYPDGRKKVREDNKLKILKEQEKVNYCININVVEE